MPFTRLKLILYLSVLSVMSLIPVLISLQINILCQCQVCGGGCWHWAWLAGEDAGDSTRRVTGHYQQPGAASGPVQLWRQWAQPASTTTATGGTAEQWSILALVDTLQTNHCVSLVVIVILHCRDRHHGDCWSLQPHSEVNMRMMVKEPTKQTILLVRFGDGLR